MKFRGLLENSSLPTELIFGLKKYVVPELGSSCIKLTSIYEASLLSHKCIVKDKNEEVERQNTLKQCNSAR